MVSVLHTATMITEGISGHVNGKFIAEIGEKLLTTYKYKCEHHKHRSNYMVRYKS